MALPLAAALVLGGARVAATSAARRYGAAAVTAGAKYAKPVIQKGKQLADDAAGSVSKYFKKPEAPSKPDFVVDSAGTVSRAGQAAPKPSGTITVDSAGTARMPNYPLATQGSRALTVKQPPKMTPVKPEGGTSIKGMLTKGAAVASTAYNLGQVKEAKAPTLDTSNVSQPPAVSEEAAPKVSVRANSKGKVARVSVGTNAAGDGGSGSQFSLSDGTSKIGLKMPKEGDPEGGVGLKIPASVKSFGDSVSVQGSGNMDAATPQDENFGMTEEQLKKIGLDESNKELAASGSGGSWRRFLEGNIDQAGSEAYNKYGAGYGRTVMKRRLAAQNSQ